MQAAVEVKELTRVFEPKKKKEGKPVRALDSADLRIESGELFGLLGPNGAGKTTLLKILSTLLLPTSGKAYVAGYDVEKQFLEVRKRINMVSGGEMSGYGLLTVRENLWMFTQFYGIKSKTASERIDDMLARFDMADKKNEKVRTLSTGQRQKMNIIRGFVTEPEIIFLDEPTLGLDVNASRVIRDFIVEWVEGRPDRTVLLTTHYMAEADELCDRIAIIDQGRILACDTPRNLKRMVKTNTTFSLDVTQMRERPAFERLKGVGKFSTSDDAEKGLTHLKFILEDEGIVSDIVSEVLRSGSKIVSLRKTEPTLEDVFIQMVGKGLD
ncbi:MAG: ATP-binding cassette domain-containing protein [Thermoplasmata archaeon]|jgi:ABC-2 type transport system ATP-binding protein|nr:ATP-binding cassette domain-containing protein [Thermoplasmata archaeon]